MNQNDLIRSLLGESVKRSIFVSYHHHGDKAYYDAFSNLLADTYGIIQDNSVEREIDSNDAEYVIRKIRESKALIRNTRNVRGQNG